MPGMNSIDPAHGIHCRYHDPTVAPATGYSHDQAQNRTFGSGLLHKPHSAEELPRVLRKVTVWHRKRTT